MFKAIDQWMSGYWRSVRRRPVGTPAGPRHLMFGICDHFEPSRSGRTRSEWPAWVEAWCRRHAALAEFQDGEGRCPQHTFFYPEEEYEPGCLDALAQYTAAGRGEVEIHLHHRHDTSAGLRTKLETYVRTLRERHGLLGSRGAGPGPGEGVRLSAAPAYAFIHGNWALGNSRPDGDWCGVNDELTVLLETGCYVDFTFPSAPSPTQPRMVNCIYRARDTGRPRAADHGEVVTAPEAGTRRTAATDGSLMLITGPLALDWGRRKWGILPRLENGALTGVNPPSRHRADLWVRQAIHVVGRPEWRFVKVYAHGGDPAHAEALLGEPMRQFLRDFRQRYHPESGWQLHYVTAREMYNIARAAEDGRNGDPTRYRDYEIAPPPVRGSLWH